MPKKKNAGSRSKAPVSRAVGVVSRRQPQGFIAYNGRKIANTRQAPKPSCRFEVVPMEIVFNIMDALGWEGSVALGLTCPEMYEAYKRLYPSKVPLESLVDTTTTTTTGALVPGATAQVKLHKLIGNWRGLGKKYVYYLPPAKESIYSIKIPGRFLLKSVYGVVNKNSPMFCPEMVERRRLLFDYTDYYCYSAILEYVGYFPTLPGWTDTLENALLVFEGFVLPSPYTMEREEWDKKVVEVIVRSIEVARDKRHWKWHWRALYIWLVDRDRFNSLWAPNLAEMTLDKYFEWIEMTGF